MASQSVCELLAGEKLVELWPNYPSLYDVRAVDFKDRDRRQHALEEIAKEVDQNGVKI